MFWFSDADDGLLATEQASGPVDGSSRPTASQSISNDGCCQWVAW